MAMKKKKLYSTLFIVCLFTVVFGAGLVQATPAPAAAVGYVDFLYLINNHPDTPKANEELKAVQEQLKKEFETKSVGLSDQQKRELDWQLGQQVEQKRQELLKPITEKIAAAIKTVRVEKGLSIVVARNIVVDGGEDITSDVLKKLTGK